MNWALNLGTTNVRMPAMIPSSPSTRRDNGRRAWVPRRTADTTVRSPSIKVYAPNTKISAKSVRLVQSSMSTASTRALNPRKATSHQLCRNSPTLPHLRQSGWPHT